MREALEGLEPKALWSYFDMIADIPRCSGNEQKIQARLAALGEERGLEVRQDAVGNLVLVIPASKGCEAWPTVVLQGHVDMVCEKNRDVEHDFARQGIEIVRDGDWLTADGTTLGADNGVGVAAALALIDDPPEEHGAIELCFTVDEERGLTGASRIEPHMLDGRKLLNLDSEEEGFVTVGCAGGGDTVFVARCRREPVPEGWQAVTFWVKGFEGGHSGVDIHENRANSLRCMGRLLDEVGRKVGGLRLFSIEGGSKRNAIPREAVAVAALPAGGRAAAESICTAVEAALKTEFGPTDPELRVLLEDAPADKPERALTATDTDRLVRLLLATPTGVIAMSRDIVGLVETSTNLGVVEMRGDAFRFVSCSRSSVGPALDATQQSLRAIGEAVGAEVSFEGGYPGWMPNLSSELLATFKRVHEAVTGEPPEVIAIHAGLECGILGERFQGMDMISFGPDMHGVHAPGERLSIPSTQRFFALLKALLSELRS